MPRYARSVHIDAGVVRRVRGSLKLTQPQFASRMHVTVRTLQRWELEGAVLEHWPSLLMSYRDSRLGLFDELAELAMFRLSLVAKSRSTKNVVLLRAGRVRGREPTKRLRKIAQATRSRRGPARDMEEK